jgi:hypothetical protein
MDWTRREFLVSAALLPSVAVAVRPATVASPTCLPHDDPAYLVGDPYLATVDDHCLGGRDFADARERAFRFRSPAFERDRHALGLDPDRA